MVSILVGLVINKTPVIGIVYIPVLDQMYTAIRGKGAYMNGEKLQVELNQEKLIFINRGIKIIHECAQIIKILSSRSRLVTTSNNLYTCWRFGPNKMIHL